MMRRGRGPLATCWACCDAQVLTKMTEMFPGAATADAGSFLGAQQAPPP